MKKIIGLFLLGFSVMAHAANDSQLTVKKGSGDFVVNLAANPTTGFQWKVMQYDQSILRLKSSVYQKNSSKLIGSGGQMVFTFGLKKGASYPSKTNILFQYARPWEKVGATQQKVVVYLK
ncbi:MAG: hypothetical protein EPN84_00030 [Legionella sp.]|nr:MAG: hypothetical protein EPN84_00030 [Legionella sp.]